MTQMVPMTLPEALEAINVQAHKLLVAAAVEGQLLQDVDPKAIIRGDRARPTPPTPSVWLVPDIATADHTTHGLAELWNYQLIIAALVKNDDPNEGFAEATDLAGKAVQVLLGRRRTWTLGFVEHVTPVRFDPSSARNSDSKRSLFWADGVVNVRFTRLEPGG